jgi:microcompartment protein CcmK/EutM
MIICKVLKPLVSTNRIADFQHKHLQVVLDGSTQKVAVDAVGAIPREAAGSKSYPSDLTIVGIIDHWDPDAAKAMAAGSSSASSAGNSASGSAKPADPSTPSGASSANPSGSATAPAKPGGAS